MKKLYSLLFAVASTLFLLVGAARAAEKFDTISNGAKLTTFSETVFEGPSLPTAGGGEEVVPD